LRPTSKGGSGPFVLVPFAVPTLITMLALAAILAGLATLGPDVSNALADSSSVSVNPHTGGVTAFAADGSVTAIINHVQYRKRAPRNRAAKFGKKLAVDQVVQVNCWVNGDSVIHKHPKGFDTSATWVRLKIGGGYLPLVFLRGIDIEQVKPCKPAAVATGGAVPNFGEPGGGTPPRMS